MHKIPNFVADMPGLVYLCQGEDLLGLELIKIVVDAGSFDNVLLSIVSGLVVVVLNEFPLLEVVVLQIPDAMAKVALLAAVDAESS